jgi:hypothetical protein
MDDTNELRRLAEAAQAEPWWNEDTFGEHHGFTDEDAAFIAAASPATVLDLLDKIDAINAAWMDDLEMSLQYLRESNDAREAVKRLAGALANMMSNSDRANKMAAAEVMRDHIVTRIVEGE